MKILRIGDAPGGNYERKVDDLFRSGKIRPPEFRNVEIRHDDWCDLLAGVGPCNCDPDVGIEVIQ